MGAHYRVDKPGITWLSQYRPLGGGPIDEAAHAALVARATAAIQEVAPLLLTLAHGFGMTCWLDEGPSFVIAVPEDDCSGYSMVELPEISAAMLVANPANAASHIATTKGLLQ